MNAERPAEVVVEVENAVSRDRPLLVLQVLSADVVPGVCDVPFGSSAGRKNLQRSRLPGRSCAFVSRSSPLCDEVMKCSTTFSAM